jgi:hypothetical protein
MSTAFEIGPKMRDGLCWEGSFKRGTTVVKNVLFRYVSELK